ncbi:hypothetical protein M758_12G058400 [Ceratodon purpureus]|nr:hypothetical protein M758_12G058400 [Ceratodon purpureus]
MAILGRRVLSIASVLVFMLLTWTHGAACEPDVCRRIGERGDCVGGGGEGGCVWCDVPQRCVSAAQVLEFGADSCFGRLRRQSRRLLDERNECGTIATKDLCSKVDYCKWCRSEVLDDTCFGAAESARLPRTIFLCSDVS